MCVCLHNALVSAFIHYTQLTDNFVTRITSTFVVVVVLVVGPISTAAMKAYCTLTPPPPVEFRHSSPEALHTKRRERPVSEGRN
jgi:hypothetical protein